MRDENPTVYSTEKGRLCPKCSRPVAQCVCKKGAHLPETATLPRDGIVRVQRESKGRKGKTVTLISGVPLNGETLRGLLSDLKRLCGSGGTIKDGVIEIQGDHREIILEALKKRGYNVKKSGG
jgi:translation initiation factor 1